MSKHLLRAKLWTPNSFASSLIFLLYLESFTLTTRPLVVPCTYTSRDLHCYTSTPLISRVILSMKRQIALFFRTRWWIYWRLVSLIKFPKWFSSHVGKNTLVFRYTYLFCFFFQWVYRSTSALIIKWRSNSMCTCVFYASTIHVKRYWINGCSLCSVKS